MGLFPGLLEPTLVLTSPPVYEEVLKLVSNKKPVFNLFERVDPMSLKVIKDKILEKS